MWNVSGDTSVLVAAIQDTEHAEGGRTCPCSYALDPGPALTPCQVMDGMEQRGSQAGVGKVLRLHFAVKDIKGAATGRRSRLSGHRVEGTEAQPAEGPARAPLLVIPRGCRAARLRHLCGCLGILLELYLCVKRPCTS